MSILHNLRIRFKEDRICAIHKKFSLELGQFHWYNDGDYNKLGVYKSSTGDIYEGIPNTIMS